MYGGDRAGKFLSDLQQIFCISSLQARGVAGRFTSPGLRKSLLFPLEAHTCGYQKTIWFSRSGLIVLFIAKSITLGDP